MVIHLYADIGQLPGEWQTGDPSILAYINRSSIPNQLSDLGKYYTAAGTDLFLDKEVVVRHLTLGPLTSCPIPSLHYPAP